MKKVALVTGASRGIGRAVAAKLAREGYAVCVNYRERKDMADSLVEHIRAFGGEAIAVQADVSERAAVENMVAVCERELGQVTLLVNNAGITRDGLLLDVAMVMTSGRVRVKELYGKDLPGGRSTFTVRFEVKDVAELDAIRNKLLNIRDVVGSRRGQN